ncbi:hypothetical protein [Tenacibaculum crassostreae]|uniref:hypothetical protein n=1 Tax=Tenacibaculum crassostreae TaxID=502683 RepID=UPI003894F083
MKGTWKTLFWITLMVLVFSNLFWVYQIIDSAVGRSYYETSCNEYERDRAILIKIAQSKEAKDDLLEFLNKNDLPHGYFPKGNNYVVSFSSFSLIFDNKGKLIDEQKR